MMTSLDPLNLRSDYGMEDMEGLLNSVDLFDGIELGDIDIAEAAGLFENSDSDSGISVSCDLKSVTDSNIWSTAESVIPVIDDCILTDVVSTSATATTAHPDTQFSPQSCPVITRLGPSKAITNLTSCTGKSIRVVKISQNNPQHVTSINVRSTTAIGHPISSQPLECFSRKVPITSNVTSAAQPQSSAHVSHPPNPSGSHSPITASCIKYEPKEIDSSFHGISSASILAQNEFAAPYDSLDNADLSFGQHLQINPFSSPTTPTYHQGLSPNQFLHDDGFLTHASLERIRKKQERMIKNRYAASMSRQRKKEYLERLEMRYDHLKRENLNLWRQNEEWRLRCDQMERRILELQAQLVKSRCQSDSDMTILPHTSATASKMARLVGPTESSSSTSAEIQSSSVAERSLHYAASPPHLCGGGTTSRTSLTSLSSTPAQNRSPPSWHIKPIQQAVRKTVANSVFYSGRAVNGSSAPTVDGDHASYEHADSKISSSANSIHSSSSHHHKSFRPNLIRLSTANGRVISRNRSVVSNLQLNRSKLIATTSLFSIFCMFSLNLLLPFSQSQNSADFPPTWQLSSDSHPRNPLPYHSAGQRTLLSWSDPSNSVRMVPAANRGQEAIIDRSDDGDQTIRASSPNISCATSVESGATEALPIESPQATSNSQNLPKFRQAQSPSPPLPSSYFGMDYSTASSRNDRILALLNQSERTPRNSHTIDSHRSGRQEPTPMGLPSSLAETRSFASVMRPRKSTLGRRSLSPFHRRYDDWNKDAILDAAGRRNDTVYLILAHLDQDYLQLVDPLYQNLATKLTLIVPAYLTKNDSNRTTKGSALPSEELKMLRVDCELRNISLIQQPRPPPK